MTRSNYDLINLSGVTRSEQIQTRPDLLILSSVFLTCNDLEAAFPYQNCIED